MPPRACVDASLVTQWLVPEDFSERALHLLAAWTKTGTELFAPTLLLYEVAAALRFLVSQKVLTEEIGYDAFLHLRKLRIRLTSRAAIFPLAWKLARDFNQPTTYDTTYLALAHLLECELWTADRKFYNAVGTKAPQVKWIGDYQTA